MPVLCSTQTATGTNTDWNKLGFVVPVQWQANVWEMIKLYYIKKRKRNKPTSQYLSKKIFTVFVVVAVGLTLSLLAFIWEMIFANRYNKWQPEATDEDAVQDEQQTYFKNYEKKTTELFFKWLAPNSL